MLNARSTARTYSEVSALPWSQSENGGENIGTSRGPTLLQDYSIVRATFYTPVMTTPTKKPHHEALLLSIYRLFF